MLTFKEAVQWAKYSLIIVYSTVINKSVVDFFGSTYVVSGNFVRRVR